MMHFFPLSLQQTCCWRVARRYWSKQRSWKWWPQGVRMQPLPSGARHMTQSSSLPLRSTFSQQSLRGKQWNVAECLNWTQEEGHCSLPIGAKFYIPPPPTPENTPLGVGGRIKKGGRIKFLLRGASKYTPPPSPCKMSSCPKWGVEGGERM